MSEQIYKAVWNEALNRIHDEYKKQGQDDFFKLWFKMDYVEDTFTDITVSVPSDFMWVTMVKNGYVKAVQSKIEELTGQHIEIKYIIKSKNQENDIYEIKQESEIKPEIETQKNKENSVNIFKTQEKIIDNIEQNRIIPKHPQLREDYTFETFVSGDNSAFAYNAALAVAKNPGEAYNPILIYGGVGLGKTHLMQSIGNYIYNKKGTSVKICYVSAENFTNEFTFSIGNKTIEKFKTKYRKLDVLLLDDIHFLQGKDATQEELFHTFEALYNKKAQMVFTCDRPISELKGITDRLKTRFSRGMNIDLLPPNYETRKAILNKKLAVLNKKIPSEVVDYIAKNLQTNVRDLEASLTKIIGYTDLTGKLVTKETAQDLLRDTFSQPSNGTITIETIQKVVADHYNISLADIKSKRRNKKFVQPRQIAIYIAREITDYSFPELGNEFGGRDHTTAMHSYDKVSNQLKIDPSLSSIIETLKRAIKDYKK